MKAHADNKPYVKPCNKSPGEAVLVKRPYSVSKGGTVYDPIPMTVVSKKGSMITAEGENRTNQLLAPEMMSRTRSVFRSHYPLLKVGRFLVQLHQTLSSPRTAKLIYQAQATLYLFQGVRPRPLNLLLNHHCADQPGIEFPERFWTCSLSLSQNCGLQW